MSEHIVYPSLAGERAIPKFEPRQTLENASKGAAVGALFGLNVVLIRNSLSASRTFAGGLRGNMGAVAVYSLVGAAYCGAEAISANLREQNTAANAFAGGAAAGTIIGASLQRSVAKSIGGALILGFAAATFDWGFNRGRTESLRGGETKQVVLDDEHPKQGFWDLVHRRPLSQTIEELGDLAKQFVRN